MPHYNAYDSFKTKKSIEKKRRAKESAFCKKNETVDNFIIDYCDEYGVVIEVRYDDAYVLYNGKIVLAKLRKDINLVCNKAVFPGDKVDIGKINDTYVIKHLLKRISILSRTKKDSTRLNDVGTTKNIATNVDLAVIVVAAKEPPLHPKFIDRYLMILQNSNIPTIICLNKCDLKTYEDEEILSTYRNLGIDVLETSTYRNLGIDELKAHLINKQAIFLGNSGVGKSSLTNAIMGDDKVKTSHVSDKSKRGRHTTTTSKYYVWEYNSSIIDTPGIRSLDVSSFSPIEIQEYFPEFENWKDKCKYNDCIHFNEPYDSCLVKQGVASGLISLERYESYLRIMSDVLGEKDYEKVLEEVIPNFKYKLTQKVKNFIEGATLSEISIGCSDSQVIRIEKNNKIYFLKMAKKGLLTQEFNALNWLNGKLSVPKIVLFDDETENEFLITKAIPGEMVCSEKYLDNPMLALEIIKQAFDGIYSVDISDCPFDVSNKYKLSLVKNNVKKGLIKNENLKSETLQKFGSVEGVLDYLINNQFEEELCFSHGDTSLPNIFSFDDKFSGFIDVGECGIADKWFDLAICEKSIRRNFGEKYISEFYKKLNIVPDRDKIDYYLLMMELYL